MTTEMNELVTETKFRTFASVREPNTRWQIKDGDSDPEFAKLNAPVMTFNGPVTPPIRHGDKFVHFRDGVYSTNDPECIAWCEAKYPLIFDLEDPTSEEIAALDAIRTETASYEPVGNVAGIGNLIDGIKGRTQRAIDIAVAKAREEWEAEQANQINPVGTPVEPVSFKKE